MWKLNMKYLWEIRRLPSLSCVYIPVLWPFPSIFLEPFWVIVSLPLSCLCIKGARLYGFVSKWLCVNYDDILRQLSMAIVTAMSAKPSHNPSQYSITIRGSPLPLPHTRLLELNNPSQEHLDYRVVWWVAEGKYHIFWEIWGGNGRFLLGWIHSLKNIFIPSSVGELICRDFRGTDYCFVEKVQPTILCLKAFNRISNAQLTSLEVGSQLHYRHLHLNLSEFVMPWYYCCNVQRENMPHPTCL